MVAAEVMPGAGAGVSSPTTARSRFGRAATGGVGLVVEHADTVVEGVDLAAQVLREAGLAGQVASQFGEVQVAGCP